jgi:hypothetical protein
LGVLSKATFKPYPDELGLNLFAHCILRSHEPSPPENSATDTNIIHFYHFI